MKPSVRKISESVSNFIEKTYEILEQKQNENIIGWTGKGLSFLIKDVKLFESLILPKYFKHSNFSSFVRQLNMYSFHKVRGQKNDNQFQHQKFRRGNRQLLCKIKRKSNDLPVVSTTSIQYNHNHHPQSIETPLKQAQNVASEDEQHGKQNSENQNATSTLDELREKNKQLRKSKQIEQSKLKNMSSINQAFVAQKFYKLVASLLTQKIKNQINLFCKNDTQIVENGNTYPQDNLPVSFDELISHVVQGEQPMEFKNYQRSAKLLMSKHTDQYFMLRKTNKSQNNQQDS